MPAAAGQIQLEHATQLAAARRRFGAHKTAEMETLGDTNVDDPDALQNHLTKAMDGVEISPDDELTTAARALLALLDPQRDLPDNVVVDARDAQGVHVGSHGQITIHNHAPRRPRQD